MQLPPVIHPPTPQLPILFPPTLSTPLAPTIPLSPQRPTLSRLWCNLFKYFDISPPLTSRAEMICDSWRWARLEELPLTPCPPYLPPILLCSRAGFSSFKSRLYSSFFIHQCSSCQLGQALKGFSPAFFCYPSV